MIALVVSIVAIFSANPRENHLMTIKRILRYLKGTEDYGLWYKKVGSFYLKTFTDVDWEGNVDDRNRTTSGSFFVGKRLVSWTNKKQNFIS